MAQTTYNFDIVADGIADVRLVDDRVFKGTIDVTLNFTFSPAPYDVVKLRLEQRGKQRKLFEGTALPKTIQYTIQPSSTEYIIKDITSITIYYSNFESVEYVIPVYVAQPSIYSDFGGMRVVAAQLLDTKAAGDTFVVMQTRDRTIHNLVLYANEITPAAAQLSPPSIVAAVSAAWSADPRPILTQAEKYIQVEL
jgi:hypothetical protein